MSREAVEYEAFEPSHLAGAIALCEQLGWPSYTDPTGAAVSAVGW